VPDGLLQPQHALLELLQVLLVGRLVGHGLVDLDAVQAEFGLGLLDFEACHGVCIGRRGRRVKGRGGGRASGGGGAGLGKESALH
jgi:hypothetical protein